MDSQALRVSSAGDVIGDGFDDILIGAPVRPNGPQSVLARAMLCLGQSGGFSATSTSGSQRQQWLCN
jgi:hypothetical protein